MITGFIKCQKLILTHPLIVADTIDYLTAQFCFQTADWEGADKWVHFKQGEQVWDVQLDHDKITADKHLNLSAGEWEVYLHGGKNGQRITTTMEKLVVVATGTMNGDVLPDVPPTVAEQVAQTSTAAKLIAENALEEAKKTGPFAEQAQKAATNAAESEKAAGESEKAALLNANSAKLFADGAALNAEKSDKSAKEAKQAVTDAKAETENAKIEADRAASEAVKAGQEVVNAQSEVQRASGEADRAAGEVVKAQAEVQNAKTEVGNAAAEVVKAQNEVKNAAAEVGKAQNEVVKATQEADRAKAEADRAAENAVGLIADDKVTKDKTWSSEKISTEVKSAKDDVSLNIKKASVGDTIKVKAVDAEGKPTEWENVKPDEWEVIVQDTLKAQATRWTQPLPKLKAIKVLLRVPKAVDYDSDKGTVWLFIDSTSKKTLNFVSAHGLSNKADNFIAFPAIECNGKNVDASFTTWSSATDGYKGNPMAFEGTCAQPFSSHFLTVDTLITGVDIVYYNNAYMPEGTEIYIKGVKA